MGESAADSALYDGAWVQVDNDFLGVDLAALLAPQRLAWVIADPVGLGQTGIPGDDPGDEPGAGDPEELRSLTSKLPRLQRRMGV